MESIVMRDPASKSLQCWNALSDITEHQRNEAALARSNAQLEQRVAERTRLLTESQGRLRAILNTVVDAVIAIDRNGIITGMNPATERMFGYTEAEMLGQNVKMLMPSPHREKHDRYLEKYVHTDASRIIGAGRKMRGQRKDGSTFPIELAVGEVDHLGLFTGVIRDITQRKQLERQLLESAERMQREFGHEMHDGLGQRLTGLELLSHRLARNLQKDSSPRADQAAQLNDELRETLKQARLMAHRLAPVPMEGDGLMRALAELAASTNLLPDVQCHFLCHPPVQIHDATAATHLYRIAQEAVNNALKHGKAGRVNIGLEEGPNDIELTVENNGRTPRAERLSGAVGVGLNLMRYRADLIGANVSIEPLQPRGVRVLCTLPKKA